MDGREASLGSRISTGSFRAEYGRLVNLLQQAVSDDDDALWQTMRAGPTDMLIGYVGAMSMVIGEVDRVLR